MGEKGQNPSTEAHDSGPEQVEGVTPDSIESIGQLMSYGDEKLSEVLGRGQETEKQFDGSTGLTLEGSSKDTGFSLEQIKALLTSSGAEGKLLSIVESVRTSTKSVVDGLKALLGKVRANSGRASEFGDSVKEAFENVPRPASEPGGIRGETEVPGGSVINEKPSNGSPILEVLGADDGRQSVAESDTARSTVLDFAAFKAKRAGPEADTQDQEVGGQEEAAPEAAETRRSREVIDEAQGQRGRLARELFSTAIGLVPGVGEAKYIIDAIKGKDILTGRKMTGKERIFLGAVGTIGLALWLYPPAGAAGEAARAVIAGEKGAEKALFVGKSTGLVRAAGEMFKGLGCVKEAEVALKTASFMAEHPALVAMAERNVARSLEEAGDKYHPNRQEKAA